MVALFFEAYGAFCLFSLIAFLIWAAVAKLRPDLDEEGFEELEKLKKLASFEPSGAPRSEDPNIEKIVEELSRPATARPLKRSKRLIPRHPHPINMRNPRTT